MILNKIKDLFLRWNQLFPTFGMFSLALLWLVVISGFALIVHYDVKAPADSLQLVFLTSPYVTFFRSLHYWAAQFFLVMLVIHAVEYLINRIERRILYSTWLKLVGVTCMSLYAMITGYMLKGDAEGELARQIFRGLVRLIPLGAKIFESFLVGENDSLMIIYIQHISLATIVLLLLSYDHSRRLWPSKIAWLVVTILVGILAFVLPPGLHDGFSEIIKGPWYFLCLQELLHWSTSPALVVYFFILLFVGIIMLPFLPNPYRRVFKYLQLAFLGIALILFVLGFFFRGANWEFGWNGFRPGHYLDYGVYRTSEEMLASEKIPQVDGVREGCLVCHSDVKGLDKHQNMGCYSCHRGMRWYGDKKQAHRAMITGKMDLEHHKNVCRDCHGKEVRAVEHSIMTRHEELKISCDDCHLVQGAEGEHPYYKRLTYQNSRCLRCHDQMKVLNENYSQDVHLKGGMFCTSCHRQNDSMGTGQIGISRGMQTKISCDDCHRFKAINSSNIRMAKSGERIKKLSGRQGEMIFNHGEKGKIALKKIGNDCLVQQTRHSQVACSTCHVSSSALDVGQLGIATDGYGQRQIRLFAKRNDGTFTPFVFHMINGKALRCNDCHGANAHYVANGQPGAFEEAKQARLRKVGECLKCHKPNSKIYDQFETSLTKQLEQCIQKK